MTDGIGFEKIVHTLFKKMGFEAEITKATVDGGIDIIAHSKADITSGKYIIQCKDWSKPVGEPPVRDLYGVVTAENANKGILITTSFFTAPALKFAEGKPLELIDGTKFNQLLTKYSIMGAQRTTPSNPNDEQIKILTEQLNKNPENILVLKELADIYLSQCDYNKAVELYKRIKPLKPSVETERLKNAYYGGLNNYGVALAKLKRYDDALKIFKENRIALSLANEAFLTHYIGLYDIAISIYQRIKSVYADTPAFIDNHIEEAYLQMQMNNPILFPFTAKNAELQFIPLEIALQKAEQEGQKDIYSPITMKALDIIKEFDNICSARSNINNIDIVTFLDIKNRCFTVISESKDVLNIITTNALQEAYKESLFHQITLLNIVYDGISKYVKCIKDFNIEETREEIIGSCYSAFVNKISEYNLLGDRIDEEKIKVTAKWEQIINKEKTEWCEKLRSSLYSNWSPTGYNKQCFIATAAYGSYLDPHVITLVNFRDKHLMTNYIGKVFIKLYYKVSPPIAHYIKENETLRVITRWILTPVVYGIKYPQAIIKFGVMIGIFGYRRFKRKSGESN